MSSIRSRLLLILVPLTVAALALTAFGIDLAVRRDLREARDRQLLLLARGIGSAVDVEIDGTVHFELNDEDMVELKESARDAFFAVADEEGAVLFSSSAPPEGLLPVRGEGPVYLDSVIEEEEMRVAVIFIDRDPQSDDEDVEEWLEEHPGEELPDGKTYRYLVAAGQADRSLSETVLLVRRRLVIGFCLLGALLLAVPLVATGFSLRPLERLSRQADRVDTDNLHARLDEEAVDREVRSLVTALNRALDRLGIAYDRQKRFTADAAHELRAPLSAIRAQVEVSLRKEREREDLEEVLRSVHRVTLRLGDVVENLLSLSRLQNGSSVIERKPVDLADTAGTAMSLLAPLAESKGARLKAELAGAGTVSGEAGLLLECVTILVDNAIRYTPEGGLITVRTGDGEHPWFSVADTGIGIPEEHLGRIFERFYRVEPSRSRTGGGSGLGLSIADAIARLHDAKISVSSTPGQGSLFTLSFRKHPQEEV